MILKKICLSLALLLWGSMGIASASHTLGGASAWENPIEPTEHLKKLNLPTTPEYTFPVEHLISKGALDPSKEQIEAAHLLIYKGFPSTALNLAPLTMGSPTLWHIDACIAFKKRNVLEPTIEQIKAYANLKYTWEEAPTLAQVNVYLILEGRINAVSISSDERKALIKKAALGPDEKAEVIKFLEQSIKKLW